MVVEEMTFLEWAQYRLLIKEIQPHNYFRYVLFYKWKALPIQTTVSGKMLHFKEMQYREENYLPPSGVIDKTILDVGAGCGETAWFFFEHGAKKVICIEPDIEKVLLLEFNAQRFKWNIEILQRGFKVQDMNRQFDFAKIDCEGCEAALLSLAALPPMAVEIHRKQLAQDFSSLFPEMRISKRFHWPFNTWIGRID